MTRSVNELRRESELSRAELAATVSQLKVRITDTAEDIRYVGDRMLELCFTAENRTQTVSQLQWLNDTLAQLHMSDRAYPLPADGDQAKGQATRG